MSLLPRIKTNSCGAKPRKDRNALDRKSSRSIHVPEFNFRFAIQSTAQKTRKIQAHHKPRQNADFRVLLCEIVLSCGSSENRGYLISRAGLNNNILTGSSGRLKYKSLLNPTMPWSIFRLAVSAVTEAAFSIYFLKNGIISREMSTLLTCGTNCPTLCGKDIV